MSEFSRRVFLKGGTAAIVAAGAISAVPGLPALVGIADTQGPADVGAAESAAADSSVGRHAQRTGRRPHP